ncbi:hypothetical protein SAMN04488030_0888 [Aliiroseovarius halocynthiae]|uniref:Uncharacterized protein n=1 Tax=Aliiroseovarius halocynthiae TaxID=985055 RepID=A0A545SV37_9RHOB|nr:hypothetical protein [Aliiroseovarius halocynthiae]TQV68832.1 hypothetical protein FIL88_04420 [Aliiroseovarius halocynthiae]SMR71261.1 hypothetical protein SAMN04488030_0888 [Aliiroseovarius halocynthiae]
MGKYNIPSYDRELVRACFDAAEDVIRDLKENPPANKLRIYKADDIKDYRIAMANMFLQLDINARNN